MRHRLQPKRIESIFDPNGVVAIDTLDSGNDAIQVVLYSNNTWKYVRNREIAKDSTIFEKYWDTKTLFPYKEVDMSSMPQSVVIDLIDSLTGYYCPYQGSVCQDDLMLVLLTVLLAGEKNTGDLILIFALLLGIR